MDIPTLRSRRSNTRMNTPVHSRQRERAEGARSPPGQPQRTRSHPTLIEPKQFENDHDDDDHADDVEDIAVHAAVGWSVLKRRDLPTWGQGCCALESAGKIGGRPRVGCRDRQTRSPNRSQLANGLVVSEFGRAAAGDAWFKNVGITMRATALPRRRSLAHAGCASRGGAGGEPRAFGLLGTTALD
jgi:hypothetical protein